MIKLNDVLILTKYETIDPGELIANHFKSSHLNSYLKYLKNIEKLDLGEKDKITKEIYKEALKDYVTVRVNWINNYLRCTDFGFFKDDGGSLHIKYYTPEIEYEIPSKKYLISLSNEELRNFLYTLPTKIKDG